MSNIVEISPVPADLTLSELCSFLRLDEQELQQFKLVDGNAVILFHNPSKAKLATFLTGVKLRGINVRVKVLEDEDNYFEEYNILPVKPSQKEQQPPPLVIERPVAQNLNKEVVYAYNVMQKTSVGARRALDENDPFGIALSGKVSSALFLFTLTVLTLSTIFG